MPAKYSFGNAIGFCIQGIGACLGTERHFRVHVAATVIVVSLGFVLQISRIEWFFTIISICAVLAAELFNSAIEKLCDTLHPGRNRGIGQVKDMSAAAVLLVSIGAAICGSIIFLPKLYTLIFL